MYNGIGLTTPRGSGTNGYIQANLGAYHKKPQKTRDQFLAELKQVNSRHKQFEEKANPDILEFQRKRAQLNQVLKLKATLKAEGLAQQVIVAKVQQFKQTLNTQPDIKADKAGKVMTGHSQVIEKQRKLERMRRALNMPADYKMGSAYEHQQAQRLAARQCKKQRFRERSRSNQRVKNKRKKRNSSSDTISSSEQQ